MPINLLNDINSDSMNHLYVFLEIMHFLFLFKIILAFFTMVTGAIYTCFNITFQ